MLLFKEADLKLIRDESVLQSFENHDGFLLKAYVIGEFFHLVVRPSIKNLPKGSGCFLHALYGTLSHCIPLPFIFCLLRA